MSYFESFYIKGISGLSSSKIDFLLLYFSIKTLFYKLLTN